MATSCPVCASSIPALPKIPFADKPYSFDWTDWLNEIGDTIASSFWVVPSDQQDLPGNTAIILADDVTPNFGAAPSPQYGRGGTFLKGNITTIMLSGGTPGNQYTIQNCITTAGGVRDARQMLINCGPQ